MFKRKCQSIRKKISFGAFFLSPNFLNSLLETLNLLRERNFQLFVVPAGGAKLYNWNLSSFSNENLPEISLLDVDLSAQNWHSSICCCVSYFIDVDSADPIQSFNSIVQLEKELENAYYLGVPIVAINLRRKCCPKLAEVLKHWINSRSFRFRFWIILPTNAKELLDASDLDDVWTIWAEFRRLCNNSKKLSVALRLCSDSDDEFSDSFLLSRWKGEPLESIWIDDSLFTSNLEILHATSSSANKKNCIDMNSFYRNLVLTFGDVISHIVLIASDCEILKLSSKLALLNGFVNDENLFFQLAPTEALDIPQIPLQPLAHNLSSIVYQTFEADKTKYSKYREAIYTAVVDILKRSLNKFVVNVFVLGAGRGPLVQVLFDVENQIRNCGKIKFTKQWAMKKWAVEKNPQAFRTLQYYNTKRWHNSVNLLQCDMRQLAKTLNGFPVPDLIVSELLGSFGDNELSPECLDGVYNALGESTICIPQSYKNYLAPIHSIPLQQNLQALEAVISNEPTHWETGRNQKNKGKEILLTDRSYVVCMQNVCLLADPLPCFEFSHSNFKLKSNSRTNSLHFCIPKQIEMVGFAGFFEACLYADVYISILPERRTLGMASWSPIFFPIRRPLQISQCDVELYFIVNRKVDEKGVWYEWQIDFTENKKEEILNQNSQELMENKLTKEPVQNLNGTSQYFCL